MILTSINFLLNLELNSYQLEVIFFLPICKNIWSSSFRIPMVFTFFFLDLGLLASAGLGLNCDLQS